MRTNTPLPHTHLHTHLHIQSNAYACAHADTQIQVHLIKGSKSFKSGGPHSNIPKSNNREYQKSYLSFCDHGPAFGAQKQFSKTNLKDNEKEDNGVENHSSQYAQDLLFPQLRLQGNLGL